MTKEQPWKDKIQLYKLRLTQKIRNIDTKNMNAEQLLNKIIKKSMHEARERLKIKEEKYLNGGQVK